MVAGAQERDEKLCHFYRCERGRLSQRLRKKSNPSSNSNRTFLYSSPFSRANRVKRVGGLVLILSPSKSEGHRVQI